CSWRCKTICYRSTVIPAIALLFLGLLQGCVHRPGHWPVDETRNARVRVIDENSDAAGADAVVVEEGDLVFTSLIEPGPRGTEGDLEAQVALVSEKVLQVLKGAGVEPRHVARLHVYAADTAPVAEVGSALDAALPPECRPPD